MQCVLDMCHSSSIKMGVARHFKPKEIVLKKSMKFTRFILYMLLKVIKHVNFIDFLSATF